MLSRKAKYAIKALILIAKNTDKTPLRTSQMAELGNVPKKSLEAILLELRNAGYLFSKRGTVGGYVLAKQASDIVLTGIVRLMDGPIARVSCASQFHYRRCEECTDEATCSIRMVYLKIREEELNILSTTTLADMVSSEK